MSTSVELMGIIYFLIVPMLIGMGINTYHRYRYTMGAAFGLIFYLFCGFWAVFNPSSSLSELRPVLVLIAIGFFTLLICSIFEWKRETSVFQRHAVVLLTISIAGLPLNMIKNIIEGEAVVGYSASTLSLLGYGLVLVALLFVANIIESRIYARKEGRIEQIYTLSDDEKLGAMGEGKDGLKAQKGNYGASEIVSPLRVTDWEDIEFDFQMTGFWRR